jgi:nicotinamidase-related amidase
MSQKVHLMVIDPQVDFCTPTKKGGKLYVPGAEDDIVRLSAMVDRLGSRLDDIHITLDSHHFVHIAHPIFWKDSAGRHPDPFTLITVNDVESGKWTTTAPGLFRKSLDYVKSLEKNGRYVLCIWNPHCLIGTPGHSIQEPLLSSLLKWESDNFAVVDKVTKGSNIYTEHYSAVQADVVQPDDPSTQLNTNLIRTLEEADIIAFAGEASTHCVLNTMRDILNNFSDPSAISKVVLLEDATSGIPGFEKNYQDFVKDMKKRGMQTSTTKEFLS